jgi:DNA-binding NarL/FixJ family response regulator
MTTRVLLADDDALIRAGLAVVLGTTPDLQVVAQAGDGLEAVRACEQHRPDVVLMDVRMPGVDGIEATRRLVRSCPGTRVLILTTFQHDEYVSGALRAGASGFLLKRSSPERLIDAVRTVAAGGSTPRRPTSSGSSPRSTPTTGRRPSCSPIAAVSWRDSPSSRSVVGGFR